MISVLNGGNKILLLKGAISLLIGLMIFQKNILIISDTTAL